MRKETRVSFVFREDGTVRVTMKKSPQAVETAMELAADQAAALRCTANPGGPELLDATGGLALTQQGAFFEMIVRRLH